MLSNQIKKTTKTDLSKKVKQYSFYVRYKNWNINVNINNCF